MSGDIYYRLGFFTDQGHALHEIYETMEHDRPIAESDFARTVQRLCQWWDTDAIIGLLRELVAKTGT